MYAEVLVEYNVKALDRSFTYQIPPKLENKLKVGMKVIVPFGRTVVNGFIISIKEETDLKDLKEISQIVNENIVLNTELLALGHYLKEQTLCSLIAAYNTMFPSSMKIREVRHNYDLYDTFLGLKNEKEAIRFIQNNPRSTKANELLDRLLGDEEILKNEYAPATIKKLVSLDLISLKKVTKYRINREHRRAC